MSNKNLTSRIMQKTDTSTNWDTATSFVPMKGEIIIYSDLNKIKIGDGTTKVAALSFIKAEIAEKMSSDVGSATQPIFLGGGGQPQACTYQLNKTVPADALFTDTNTWRGIQNNLTSTSATDSLSAAQGKILNEKFANYSLTSHTHNYLPIATIEDSQLTSAPNGFYTVTNPAGILLSRQWDSNYTVQLHHGYTQDYLKFRHSQAGIYSDWIKLFTYAGGTLTGNLGITNSAPQITLSNSSGTDIAIEFLHATNYDWKILSQSGYLKILTNGATDGYSAKGNYFELFRMSRHDGIQFFDNIYTTQNINISAGKYLIFGDNSTVGGRSGTIKWSGGTDSAELYYALAASNEGQLIFNMLDDGNPTIRFAWGGVTKSYIDQYGVYRGTASHAYASDTSTYATGLKTSGELLHIGNASDETNGFGFYLYPSVNADSGSYYMYWNDYGDTTAVPEILIFGRNASTSACLLNSANYSSYVLPLGGGTMTGPIYSSYSRGEITTSDTGASLLCSAVSPFTGIYNGNGDGAELGTSGYANLLIKSWYGVGFVDGCSGNGVTVAIDCRTGVVKASTFSGALSGNATSASSVPWTGVSGRPDFSYSNGTLTITYS